MINTDSLAKVHQYHRHHHHHHHNHHRGQQRALVVNKSQLMTRRTSRNTLAKIKSIILRNKATRRDNNSSSCNKMQLNYQHSITKTRISSLSLSPRRSRLAFIAITLTFFVSLILLALTRGAHSLNCYTCSSADNPACDEPFTGRANITDTDCEKHIGQPAKVCRKIIQYIEDKKVVIRSCGWIDERADEKSEKKSMCYKRSGTFALMMESCVCYEDNCNHSASLVPNQSVLTFITGCSIVYFYLAKRSSPSQQLS